MEVKRIFLPGIAQKKLQVFYLKKSFTRGRKQTLHCLYTRICSIHIESCIFTFREKLIKISCSYVIASFRGGLYH